MAVHAHYKTGPGVQKVHEEKQKLHIIPLFKELPISILAYRILDNFFCINMCINTYRQGSYDCKRSHIENTNL